MIAAKNKTMMHLRATGGDGCKRLQEGRAAGLAASCLSCTEAGAGAVG